ncbi:hypothetical protein MTR67_039130 [Solanum verrucosum]|uniref:Uncharacterized protein n=1 Tax=Solanum verrucosum TaxID=315347 RepID=A0AAF0UGE1_SOLVR|nr:hypothetical protein MTR67_039130 [Solanum verrucosum]
MVHPAGSQIATCNPPHNPSSEVDRRIDRTDRGSVHGLSIRIWIEEQSKDTNMQTGTKQAEEMKMEEPKDHQEHSTCRRVSYQTAKSSSVPIPEGKNQVGYGKEQSTD